MLHLLKKDKKQNEQVIFIRVAFIATGVVLLLWYLAPWVLNHILNAGNVLGIVFAVVLLLCGVFVQPVTRLLATGNHAPGAVVLRGVPPVYSAKKAAYQSCSLKRTASSFTGLAVMPVSSISSRHMACSGLSPFFRYPPGVMNSPFPAP